MPLTEIYAGEQERKRQKQPGIFLEGPASPDQKDDWRPDALQWLRRKPYQGIAYVPYPRSGEWDEYDEDIFVWRMDRIRRTDVVVAIWIPADSGLKEIAEISTYFGIVAQWKPEHVLLGYPEMSPAVHYLTMVARAQKIPILGSIHALLGEAIKLTRQ